MASFGSRLLEARRIKGLSQEEVAVELGTKGPAIGRYERDEMRPSVEAAAKLAEVMGVSLDHLVGKTNGHEKIPNDILEKAKLLNDLPPAIQEKILYFIDVAARDYKIREAYGLSL